MSPRRTSTPHPLPDQRPNMNQVAPGQPRQVPSRRSNAGDAFRDADAEGKAFVYSPTIALPVGTVATDLPRKKIKTKYDWDGVRTLLEANPGLWVLALQEMSSGMYSYVRRGGPDAFVGMGGHMQVSLRGQRDSETAKGKIGDLWLRWFPEGWTPDDQARVEAAHEAGEGVL